MLGGASHIAWNVFLAACAVGLAHLSATALRAHRARPDARVAVPMVIALCAWLLMLPNTCYLFTEVRHLFDAIEDRDLWSRASHSSAARYGLAIRSFVMLAYAGVGALTFGLAIRPVREACEESGRSVRGILPVFFVVVSLGVYLGLVQRLNSWDVLTRPERVIANAIDAMRASRRAIAIVLGGGVLWTVYEIVDIWIDGARLRWARVRRSLSAG
jgi:uncharacterized membrane protein